MTETLPPWEPTADWLCRINDCQHGTFTKQQIREEHKTVAKAIAYEIALEGVNDD